MIVLDGQQRDSTIHIHVSILPQIPLPSKLPCNIEHSSLQYTSELSCFSHVQLFVILLTVAHEAPLSMGFSRQEYCSGLPCPLPGDLPDPGNEPKSLMSPALAGGFFTISTTWGRFLLAIHLKYGIYMTLPTSLTIPSPHAFPSNRKFVL